MTTSRPSAASIYGEASIENAPPVKLVRLLYQGAIRFLDTAAACDPRAADSKFNHWLGRAEDIVVELRISIEPGPAPEIAASLSDLYGFVENAIREARRDRKVEPLAGARTVLATLLEAWTAIDTRKS